MPCVSFMSLIGCDLLVFALCRAERRAHRVNLKREEFGNFVTMRVRRRVSLSCSQIMLGVCDSKLCKSIFRRMVMDEILM